MAYFEQKSIGICLTIILVKGKNASYLILMRKINKTIRFIVGQSDVNGRNSHV